MGFWIDLVVDAASDGLMALWDGRRGRKAKPESSPTQEQLWVVSWPDIPTDSKALRSDYYFWLWRLAAKGWPDERFMVGPAGLPAVTAVGWVDGQVVVELMDAEEKRERFANPPELPPDDLRCAFL